MTQDTFGLKGELQLVVTSQSGEVVSDVTIPNLIVTAGKTVVASSLIAGTGSVAYNYMAVGTGTAGPAIGDTILGSEAARVTSTTSSSGNVATFVGTYSAGVASVAITEAGLFNTATVNAAGMLSHVVFAAVNKGATDTLVITWTVTCG
jgi:hypothetical protein